MASNIITRTTTPGTQTENFNKGSALTHAELDNNFYVLTVTAGTAAVSKALVLDSNGDINMGNLGVIDNCQTVQFNSELDNGSKTASFDITLDSAQKQKVTLTANTLTANLKNPTSVGNWILKMVNGGLATLTWSSDSGSIYWAGNVEPTWSSAATDIIAIYYDGTNFYMSALTGFNP